MTFSREDTKMMKGFAILLMLAHHLFLYQERLPIGYHMRSLIYFHGEPIISILGRFGTFCVPIYMFLGGYGLFCRSYSQEENSYSISIGNEIRKLYCALWKVSAVFLPIGFLFFRNQPTFSENDFLCHRFSAFAVKDIVGSFTGLTTPYNDEWWFFMTYIVALFLGAVLLEIISRHDSKHLDIGITFCLYILMAYVFPEFKKSTLFPEIGTSFLFNMFFAVDRYLPLFFLGIVTAKYNGIVSIQRHLNSLRKLPKLLFSFFILGLLLFQIIYNGDTSEKDFLYVPLLISVITLLLQYTPHVRKLLLLFGKHSTNMWLTHSFFIYYFGSIAKLICITRNPLISYLELVLVSLGSSILLDKFWNSITKKLAAD